MFLMGNFPFRFVLGVDGSNDLVIAHPGEAIPTYTEPVSVGSNFVEFPLQGTHECCPGSQWEWSYILSGSIDTDNLRGQLGEVDTDRGVFMSKRDDFEATGVEDVGHCDPEFSKNCGVGWGKLCGQLPAL
jgi:hypothetical protein